MKGLLSATVTLALTAYGCEANPAVAPTSLPPTATVPAPATRSPIPTPAGDLWKLTTTVVGLEGSACMWTYPVGKTFDWTLSAERSGAEVRLVYDVNNPNDNLSFVGTMDGDSFTATTESYSSSWACAPSVVLFSSVTGSFSADGRSVTARERFTYRIVGGGELTITLDWNATRM